MKSGGGLVIGLAWCSDSSSWPPSPSFTTFYGGRRESATVTTRKKKNKMVKSITLLGGGGGAATEESAKLELMRLHNLRFLFTVKEETKEDMELEDGRSMSRSKSLSEIMLMAAPPYMDSPRYSM
ncbi:hypothetical protein LINPERHAP1_LOCUS40388 [Linum perenne]